LLIVFLALDALGQLCFESHAPESGGDTRAEPGGRNLLFAHRIAKNLPNLLSHAFSMACGAMLEPLFDHFSPSGLKRNQPIQRLLTHVTISDFPSGFSHQRL